MIYSICTQYRNEENKLKPWILYHVEQGFNTFILYDDHSSDDSILTLKDIIQSYKINVIINQTDVKEKMYSNSLQTEEYQTDIPLNKRIARSFLNGFDTFNKLNTSVEGKNKSFCAFVDVDECLTTDNNKSVVETVDLLFDLQKTNHLYVPSFDVNTSFLNTDFKVFLQKDTQYRWSETERRTFKNGKFSHRGKSIVKFGYDFPIKHDLHSWSIVHCAGAVGTDFETAIPLDSNKNCNSTDLRIHHYRVPPNNGCTSFSQKDPTTYNEFKKVYSKYEI